MSDTSARLRRSGHSKWDIVSSAPVVTTLRIGLTLGKIATAIDANQIERVVSESATPTSWWRIIRLALKNETREALGPSLGFLVASHAAIAKQRENGASK